jgi:hypothetical protein
MIERFLYSDHGVLGKLFINFQFECYTLERPDYDNLRNVSCIPELFYSVSPHDSPKFGGCFRVNGVPERSGILFHAGNTKFDTEGCILVGSSIGFLGENLAVLNSKNTLRELRLKIQEESVLEIRRKVDGLEVGVETVN